MNKQNRYQNHAERIYHEWDKTWQNNDIEGFLALYADDAVVESPVILHLLEQDHGICRGKEALRKLVIVATKRKPANIRKYYRKGYFSNKNQLIWEYPYNNPEGTQMDFVEAIDFNDEGLITYHRVYWGWQGFKVMQNDQYHNE